MTSDCPPGPLVNPPIHKPFWVGGITPEIGYQPYDSHAFDQNVDDELEPLAKSAGQRTTLEDLNHLTAAAGSSSSAAPGCVTPATPHGQGFRPVSPELSPKKPPVFRPLRPVTGSSWESLAAQAGEQDALGPFGLPAALPATPGAPLSPKMPPVFRPLRPATGSSWESLAAQAGEKDALGPFGLPAVLLATPGAPLTPQRRTKEVPVNGWGPSTSSRDDACSPSAADSPAAGPPGALKWVQGGCAHSDQGNNGETRPEAAGPPALWPPPPSTHRTEQTRGNPVPLRGGRSFGAAAAAEPAVISTPAHNEMGGNLFVSPWPGLAAYGGEAGPTLDDWSPTSSCAPVPLGPRSCDPSGVAALRRHQKVQSAHSWLDDPWLSDASWARPVLAHLRRRCADPDEDKAQAGLTRTHPSGLAEEFPIRLVSAGVLASPPDRSWLPGASPGSACEPDRVTIQSGSVSPGDVAGPEGGFGTAVHHSLDSPLAVRYPRVGAGPVSDRSPLADWYEDPGRPEQSKQGLMGAVTKPSSSPSPLPSPPAMTRSALLARVPLCAPPATNQEEKLELETLREERRPQYRSRAASGQLMAHVVREVGVSPGHVNPQPQRHQLPPTAAPSERPVDRPQNPIKRPTFFSVF